MKKSTFKVAASALAVAAIAGAGLAMRDAPRSHPDVTRVTAAATLPDAFASKMGDMGISYSFVASVSTDQGNGAASVVSSEFSSVLSQAQGNPILEQVTFTDTGYGKVSDIGETHSVTPTYVNQPAIMVVLPHTPLPLGGPRGTNAGFMESTFVAFVDPATNKVLRAVSYNEDSKVLPFSAITPAS